jgi:hypothetical protein
MLRNATCSAALWRLIGLVAVAAAVKFGGVVAGLYAAEKDAATESRGTPESAVRSGSVGASQPDEAKTKVAGNGRIDGYLAGGRWREGSKLVDVAGQFKTSGERVAFHAADGKSRFPCLENLNSERVARIVAESPPESLEWIVQGTLTEFRNENYLLVTQAVITSRAVRGPRPSADRRASEVNGTPSSR